jgi:hypothetical protein
MISPLLVTNHEEVRVCVTEYGWMNFESFLSFLKDFGKQTRHITRPIIILVDGHASLMSLPAAEFAKVKNVIQNVCYCLPANATHVHQPAGVALFGPLKSCNVSVYNCVGASDGCCWPSASDKLHSCIFYAFNVAKYAIVVNK